MLGQYILLMTVVNANNIFQGEKEEIAVFVGYYGKLIRDLSHVRLVSNECIPWKTFHIVINLYSFYPCIHSFDADCTYNNLNVSKSKFLHSIVRYKKCSKYC